MKKLFIKKYAVLLVLSIFNSIMPMQNTIEIKPIELYQAPLVKQIILNCAIELWYPENTIQEIEPIIDSLNEFDDLNDIDTTYFNNNGTFLVLVDDQKVVGSGGVKKLTDEICEVKRVYFAKEYRGKGLGSQIMDQLLDFAKTHGYKKVRLDILKPDTQTAAVKLYKKLGFYEIAPYGNSPFPMGLFMEKDLS